MATHLKNIKRHLVLHHLSLPLFLHPPPSITFPYLNFYPPPPFVNGPTWHCCNSIRDASWLLLLRPHTAITHATALGKYIKFAKRCKTSKSKCANMCGRKRAYHMIILTEKSFIMLGQCHEGWKYFRTWNFALETCRKKHPFNDESAA